MDNLQDDDDVLQELEPVAQKLHMSSQAFLTLIFVLITMATIAFAVSVHLWHRRYHRRQQEHAERAMGDMREKSMMQTDGRSPLPMPQEAVRGGRHSWGSRGGSSYVTGDETVVEEGSPWGKDGRRLYPESETTAVSVVNSPIYPPQRQHPLRNGWRASQSSEVSAPGYSEDAVPSKGKGKDLPPAPPFRITNEGEDANSQASEYEDELYDDYYADNRESLASYYRTSLANGRRSNLPSLTTDGKTKYESTYSLNGLVDMYAGSPGSPASPKWMSRAARLSSVALSPTALKWSRLARKQPSAASPTSATTPSPTTARHRLPAAPPTRKPPPNTYDYDPPSARRDHSEESAYSSYQRQRESSLPPSPTSAYPDEESFNIPPLPPSIPPLPPSIPPTAAPYIPPPIPYLEVPQPWRPPAAAEPPRLSPSPSGSQQPRRRLRGLSLHGEIFRMGPGAR